MTNRELIALLQKEPPEQPVHVTVDGKAAFYVESISSARARFEREDDGRPLLKFAGGDDKEAVDFTLIELEGDGYYE